LKKKFIVVMRGGSTYGGVVNFFFFCGPDINGRVGGGWPPKNFSVVGDGGWGEFFFRPRAGVATAVDLPTPPHPRKSCNPSTNLSPTVVAISPLARSCSVRQQCQPSILSVLLLGAKQKKTKKWKMKGGRVFFFSGDRLCSVEIVVAVCNTSPPCLAVGRGHSKGGRTIALVTQVTQSSP
jgi:hypothetical protein